MKSRIIAMLVLLALLPAALLAAGELRLSLAEAQDRRIAMSRELNDLEDLAAKLNDEIDLLSAENPLVQENVLLNQQTQALREELETLRSQIEEMKTFLGENQEAFAEAEEELTYLQGVYDALEEGLSKVEGYIAGN